jgi:hypothetical protein
MKCDEETEFLDGDEDFVLRLPQPSAALKEKILSCQTCLPIRTQQEVDLYMKVFRDHVILSDGSFRKINYSTLCIRWNSKILEFLDKTNDPSVVFCNYSF